MRATTSSRTKRERRRSDMETWLRKGTLAGRPGRTARLLRRGQHEQQTAVIIVGREEIGDGLGREIALGMNRNALSEAAHAPFERHADVILAAVEVQAEDVA